ncbi:hypothetical protein ADIMK_3063 [Marinobacterium lacunae]|uniref:RES domain-containing protein n=1 Tax=Marinobacterium lacunae TaxID=1232683 RepID=A0A081FVN6_9GAMM|nr:RES family NAD+ phosphorylase [Marinobacterium lacunae]KEA62591.1 hypothetical protein ADIMK_3063 [Marinobacterium lacunae]
MIWERCNGSAHIAPLAGTLHRLVESQEQVATLGYVDTLEEQALLEEMLEEIKPPAPENTTHLHYLLKTPFRYPPLLWGSRFGGAHEPSLFYGGMGVGVTLAESAYYRFIFWHSMGAEPVKSRIRTEHTLFSVSYATTLGVQLHAPPFNEYESELTHTRTYAATQSIGSAMRSAGVEVFEYRSARDRARGLCVGLFTPEAFTQQTPQEQSQWFCEVSAEEASFRQLRSREVHVFKLEDFKVDGILPLPA